MGRPEDWRNLPGDPRLKSEVPRTVTDLREHLLRSGVPRGRQQLWGRGRRGCARGGWSVDAIED